MANSKIEIECLLWCSVILTRLGFHLVLSSIKWTRPRVIYHYLCGKNQDLSDMPKGTVGDGQIESYDIILGSKKAA